MNTTMKRSVKALVFSIVVALCAIFSFGIIFTEEKVLAESGIYVSQNGSVNIEGGLLDSNDKAIVISGGVQTLKGMTISGSTNGAVIVKSGAEVTIEDCVITGNTNIENGGAIAVESGAVLTINNSEITNNVSDMNGGAIYAAAGAKVTLTGTTSIRGNTAVLGGGIYLEEGALLNEGSSGLEYFSENGSLGNVDGWQNVYYEKMSITLKLEGIVNDTIIEKVYDNVNVNESFDLQSLANELQIDSALIDDYYTYIDYENSEIFHNLNSIINGAVKGLGLEGKRNIVIYCDNKLTYVLNEGTYHAKATESIIKGNVIIQPLYNNIPVTAIADQGFAERGGFTNIVMPESIKTIGTEAFFIAGIEDITIGSGVTTIKENAFWQTGLKSINIPDNVVTIERCAFAESHFLESVTIGNGVTEIGDYAFEGCNILQSITFGNSLKKIGDYVFSGLGDCLTSTITLPASLEYIGYSAFPYMGSIAGIVFEDPYGWSISEPYGCDDIEGLRVRRITVTDPEINEINLTETYFNYAWIKIGDPVHTVSGVYILNDEITVNLSEEYYSSSQIEFIGEFTSNGVKYYGVFAETFDDAGIYFMTEDMDDFVYYEDTIKVMYASNYGAVTFNTWTNNNYKYIDFGDTPIELGKKSYEWLMANATKKEDLVYTLNDDGESYSVSAKDTSISGEITIPSTYNGLPVTAIESFGFDDCKGITSIEIPNSVKSIGYEAFDCCSKLKTIYMNGDLLNNSNFLNSYDWVSNVFSRCDIDNIYINHTQITEDFYSFFYLIDNIYIKNTAIIENNNLLIYFDVVQSENDYKKYTMKENYSVVVIDYFMAYLYKGTVTYDNVEYSYGNAIFVLKGSTISGTAYATTIGAYNTMGEGISFNYSEIEEDHESSYNYYEFSIVVNENCIFEIDTFCLLADTEVEVWDDEKKRRVKKKLKDLKYTDKVLCWNFDRGRLEYAYPMWISKEKQVNRYTKLTFSDGSTLETVGENDSKRHRIYDYDKAKFVYVGQGTPVGTRTFNSKKEVVTVEKIEFIDKKVTYYNVKTYYHMNIFANGILTSGSMNEIYKIENMKYKKDGRKKVPMREFEGIDPYWVKGLRMQEQRLVAGRLPNGKFIGSWKEYVNKLTSIMKERD